MIHVRSRVACVCLAVLTWGSADARAGAWVLPRGGTWVALGLQRQDTRERYFLDGERTPYFFDGHNRTLGAFLDARYGVSDRLEAGAQLPVFRLAFDDLAGRRRSTGVGDLRLGLRYNLGAGRFTTTAGVTVKLPTGEFPNDAELVPVGEGQHDVEGTLEVGRSLWPRPAYITVLAGLRLRTRNERSGIDPGNEWLWSVEAGHRVGRVWLKGVARGLHGGDAVAFGLPVASLRREVVFVQPGLVFEAGAATQVEVTAPFTVHGRNYPAGLVLGVGVHHRF